MRWCLTIPFVLAAAPALAADPRPNRAPSRSSSSRRRSGRSWSRTAISCHGPKKQNAGLRLDTAAGLKAGADERAGGRLGRPREEQAHQGGEARGRQPDAAEPKPPLTAEAVAALTEWVKTGAAFPDDQVRAAQDRRIAKHWAFQPVKSPVVPEIRNAKAEVRNPIDEFVLAKLSDKGLSLSPRADKRTLIRRAYLDLIGLPPTAEEVEAFENRHRPEGVGEADRPIARRRRTTASAGAATGSTSPAMPTRRATSSTRTGTIPFAYTYRDYVIRSFNEDKPYDQFIIEQLAADKLQLGDDKRPLAALGFLTLGRRFLNNQQDIIDDRIDVVTAGSMGLTVELRPLPRPQVRPDSDGGLLLALRRVRQQQRAEGTAAHRGGEADAGSDRVREGDRETRGGVQDRTGQAARGCPEETPRAGCSCRLHPRGAGRTRQTGRCSFRRSPASAT